MENKRAIIITGSTRGIGYSLAKDFLKAGHLLVINGRSKDKVNKVVEELHQISPDVVGVSGSVNNEATHQSLIEVCKKTFGKIDIYVNNAGIPQENKNFIELRSEDIQSLCDINIQGLMLGTKTAAKHMIDQGFGKIFNMEGFGSDGRMMNKLTLYGTSKRAVHYFTKSISKELKNAPVQVGVLSPGMVKTDFLKNGMKSNSEKELKQFQKVYKILAEEPEVVTEFLTKKILTSTKQYDRIEFLSKGKMLVKVVRLILS